MPKSEGLREFDQSFSIKGFAAYYWRSEFVLKRFYFGEDLEEFSYSAGGGWIWELKLKDSGCGVQLIGWIAQILVCCLQVLCFTIYFCLYEAWIPKKSSATTRRKREEARHVALSYFEGVPPTYG